MKQKEAERKNERMEECVCERDRGGDKERKNEEIEKGRTAIKWR